MQSIFLILKLLKITFKNLVQIILTRVSVKILLNRLAPELFFLILAHTVYKMWKKKQEPKTLEL